jgi:hypothetical protein
MDEERFDFENLKVYQKALEYVVKNDKWIN